MLHVQYVHVNIPRYTWLMPAIFVTNAHDWSLSCHVTLLLPVIPFCSIRAFKVELLAALAFMVVYDVIATLDVVRAPKGIRKHASAVPTVTIA